MAHQSEITGKYSEAVARLALMANGWTVYQSETEEAHDILAQEPHTRKYVKIQVKTIRKRTDRAGEMVVYARKGNGEPYKPEDADYIIGVLAEDGENPRVYMFENIGQVEYWQSVVSVSRRRWIEIPIALTRKF